MDSPKEGSKPGGVASGNTPPLTIEDDQEMTQTGPPLQPNQSLSAIVHSDECIECASAAAHLEDISLSPEFPQAVESYLQAALGDPMGAPTAQAIAEQTRQQMLAEVEESRRLIEADYFTRKASWITEVARLRAEREEFKASTLARTTEVAELRSKIENLLRQQVTTSRQGPSPPKSRRQQSPRPLPPSSAANNETRPPPRPYEPDSSDESQTHGRSKGKRPRKKSKPGADYYDEMYDDWDAPESYPAPTPGPSRSIPAGPGTSTETWDPPSSRRTERRGNRATTTNSSRDVDLTATVPRNDFRTAPRPPQGFLHRNFAITQFTQGLAKIPGASTDDRIEWLLRNRYTLVEREIWWALTSMVHHHVTLSPAQQRLFRANVDRPTPSTGYEIFRHNPQGLPTAVRTRTANGRLQVNPGDVAAWRTVHMFRNDAEARERLLTVILSNTFWPVDAIEPNNANSVVIDPTLNPEEALVGWPAVSYADIHRWLRTALRWNRYFVVQFMRPYIMRSANQRRTSYWAQALDNFALVGHNMDLTRNNSLLSNVAHAFRMQAQVNPVAPAASSSSSTTSSVPTDDTMHDPTPTGSPSNEPRE